MTERAKGGEGHASAAHRMAGRLSKWADARLEIGTALVLSIAALVTSWSGYQAALWDGEQAAHYTKANAMHMEAARLSTRAGQFQALDVMAFAQWANAYGAGDRRMQDYYRSTFRPEFAIAFDSWRAKQEARDPKTPPSPFTDPMYRSRLERESDAVEESARRLFEEGQRANSVSDHFVQGGVILASALFFGGMCQTFRTPKVRLALIAVAFVACIYGTIRIFGLPIQTL